MLDSLRLWVLTYRAAILIVAFPLGLTLFDLWILAREWIDAARREQESLKN